MQSTGELAQRVLLACSELTRAATAVAPGTRLSLTQARVLGNLARRGPLRVSRLAALERCAQPTMTGLVSRLVAAGLVERREDRADARAVLVALTPDGARELETHRLRLRAPLEHAVDDLAPGRAADLERLAGLLEQLTAAVHETAPAPAPGRT